MTTIPVNPSVPAADAPRLNKQAARILARLREHGSITTSELSAMAAQYNARIYELRRHLAARGLTVVCLYQEGGDNTYVIRSAAASTPAATPPQKTRQRSAAEMRVSEAGRVLRAQRDSVCGGDDRNETHEGRLF